MKEEFMIKWIKVIIQELPEDSLIPFDEAIEITWILLGFSGSLEPIKEIVQFINRRHIEDLITIRMAATMVLPMIKQKEGSLKNHNLQFIEIIRDELSQFPGGFGTHSLEELQPLVYKIIESSMMQEWAIINSEPDVLLLDTDLGLATIGAMAFVKKDREMLDRVYGKRNRIAPLRKQVQDIIENSYAYLYPTIPVSEKKPLTPKTKNSKKVFLSYASEDYSHALTVYKKLKERGHEPWLDKGKLLPGQAWELEIEQAVEKADFFIAILSKKSVSKVGYVQREMVFGLKYLSYRPIGSIYFIPIRLDNCEIPQGIKKYQYIDLIAEDFYEKLFYAIELES